MNTTDDFKAHYVTFACDDADVVGKVVDFCAELCGEDVDYTLRTNEAVADPSKGKSFSAALLAMKCGKGARMPFWTPDMVVRAAYPCEGNMMTAPYLYIESKKGRMPYEPQALALFSEEWEIVE